MKNKSILVGALILGAGVLAAGQASAYPLYLTSASGTITYTPSYDAIQNTNKASPSTVTVNLKTIMTVVSNQVYLNSSVIVPKDAQIVYDPYQDETYLTNKSGFSHSLNNIAYVELEDMATSFKGTASTGVSETDKIVIRLDIYGRGPDGKYFEFEVYGQGTLQFSADRNQKGSMTISMANGADYGEYKSSDDGVCVGGFTFTGKGTAEWSGPFWLWWY